jgi:rfaE bifunctional protein nucleotidyltransferase chain/domain
MIIVYTTGVFDILHPGHIDTLKRARSIGDKLIVGVQDDESVLGQKGRLPSVSCTNRMAMLEAFSFVDVVIPYYNIDQREMLALIRPDIMVQGQDWTKTGDRTEIIRYLKKNGIRLIQFPDVKNISSTKIKKRIMEQQVK